MRGSEAGQYGSGEGDLGSEADQYGPHWTGSREDSPDGCSLNNCSYKGVVKSEFIIYEGIVPK